MTDSVLYAGLFLAALVSATLFPGQSEAVLAGVLVAGHPAWLMILIASVGNVLGSLINWLIGGGIERHRDKSWFPLRAEKLGRMQRWYAKFGRWSLLLSWAPVIGDPLTVVAGVMREPLPVFLLLVTIAKTARYLFVAWATLQLLG